MGGEQSKSFSGGSRQGISKSQVESILFDVATNVQLHFANDKRKSGLSSQFRKKLWQMTQDIYSRQVEFSKGNVQLLEKLRTELDALYQSTFRPQSAEDKIFVRSQVDGVVDMLQKRIEQETQTTAVERPTDPVQIEQAKRKAAAGLRNARARASATRRVRKLKGGFLSWFQQQSTDPVSVPFRNYTRSMRSARRSSHS